MGGGGQRVEEMWDNYNSVHNKKKKKKVKHHTPTDSQRPEKKAYPLYHSLLFRVCLLQSSLFEISRKH